MEENLQTCRLVGSPPFWNQRPRSTPVFREVSVINRGIHGSFNFQILIRNLGSLISFLFLLRGGISTTGSYSRGKELNLWKVVVAASTRSGRSGWSAGSLVIGRERRKPGGRACVGGERTLLVGETREKHGGSMV